MAVHMVVHGRVQGVFFRASTQKKAEELGLAGWVKNRPDGTVEIHAEGQQETLEKLIEWCRQGPALASVSSIDLDWINAGGMESFDIG
ncbi:MAG: acylphosphatase [Nitrospinaceae bacterium]|nr:acylphosphatase [Nitrospinaceae bacterium]NIR55994.1 acylphosphatase [Nitrospinaceae bacterium]NIS86437.1 acylphosphatase [Nitrospinaceae bacterium]NIT83275.1 acylphosphatase [Nitrospinaceae bacterium]NIU45482.1 acylphosphatase [Nitrospinaceae bacterium]